jgi:hypothetical protein
MTFCSMKVAVRKCEEIEMRDADINSACGGDQISVAHRIAGSISLSFVTL